MPGRETSLGGQNVRFRSTLWSVVRHAREGAREALDQLVTVYWKPVYFYVRRRGHDVESAKDLTQGFFAAGFERDFLKRVSPELGLFRTFLLAALKYYLSDEYDRSRAAKRGGGIRFVEAERDLVAADSSPERAFRRQWALETLRRAMDRLRAESEPENFALLTGAVPADWTPTQRKNRAHQTRVRLREILREDVLALVDDPSDVDGEIDEIFAALS